jgi:hypothetical protein
MIMYNMDKDTLCLLDYVGRPVPAMDTLKPDDDEQSMSANFCFHIRLYI